MTALAHTEVCITLAYKVTKIVFKYFSNVLQLTTGVFKSSGSFKKFACNQLNPLFGSLKVRVS